MVNIIDVHLIYKTYNNLSLNDMIRSKMNPDQRKHMVSNSVGYNATVNV